MAFDQEVLSAVLRDLEHERTECARTLSVRQAQVYALVPRVDAIDTILRRTAAAVLRAALAAGDDPAVAIGQLRERNLALQKERTALLLQHGFSARYLDLQSTCPVCGDLGYLGTTPCECLKARYARKLTERLSTILPIADQNFSSFRLDCYDAQPDTRIGLSARDNMRDNLETCREYARTFGDKAQNLLLYGAPGLGKTFLSSCIAGEVSRRGFSVAYDTAVAIFAHYEKAKFGGAADEITTRQLRKYEHADVLIIDDLGAEMTTSFTMSAFYTVINTRLITHRATILNTNLTPADIERRYTPAIASRILGEYAQLRFFGQDIRILKRRGRV